MKQSLAILAVTTLVAGAAAQGHDYAAWIQSRYPNLHKVTTHAIVLEAQRAGIVGEEAQLLELKRTFRQLRSKSRRGIASHRRVDYPHVPVAASPVGVDVAVENENNDGWQWADSAIGQTSALGDCSTPNDTDYWRIVSTGEFFTFSVTATGASPITDSILTVRNDRGDVLAFNDDNGGPLSQISMYLPSGIFHLEVSSYAGTAGGTYDLQIASDPATLVPITAAGASGTIRAPLGGLAHDVFTFTVPEGAVGMTVNSGQDTVMVIQRADGLQLFANDDSTAGGIDAAVDIDLPAGTYTAYVSEFGGLAGVPFTVSFAHAPRTFPDVCTTPTVVASLLGEESLRLARAVLTTPLRIDATTSNGPTLPILDTILALHDPTLDFLCDVDDDDPANPSRGFYSRLQVDLPAATYWLAMTTYPLVSGDYTLTTVCTAYAPTGTADFGPTTTTIPGYGRINSYLLDNCSLTTTFFGADDFYFGLIDRNGEAASCWYGDPAFPQGGETPAGTNTVLVWDRYDYTGPLVLDFRPALEVDGGSLRSTAKAGDLVFLFGGLGQAAPGLNLGVGDRGLFCLPFAGNPSLISLQVVPANGRLTWFAVPPGNYGIVMQTADIHTGLNWMPGPLGTWRNVWEF